MTRSALFLFAPKFREFGADIARDWAAREGGAIVHGLCTGSRDVPQVVSRCLGDLGGEMHFLPEREFQWAVTRPDAGALHAFEQMYPAGTYGAAVTSDRRVGRGYVTNGDTRPDLLGDLMIADPVDGPRNYVLGLFAFVEEVFDRVQPDLVFCYAVAGAPAFAMSEVAARRGIPFVRLAPTRLGKRYVVDDNRCGFLAPVARRYASDAAISEAGQAAALDHFTRFRDRPEAPDYHKFSRAKRFGQAPYKEFLKNAKSAWKSALPGYLRKSPEKIERARRKWFEGVMALRRGRAMRRAFVDPATLAGDYVFFPLHVAPEASTMVLSPMYTDQLAVIEALTKAIPAHTRLVVKEHMNMLGRRPEGFYEKIESLPGVIMVDPRTPGLDLLQGAALTTVITGTAAWEAFLLGKPALLIGDAQHRCVGAGAAFQSDFADLPQAIRAAMQMQPASDAQILRYLGALFDESFDLSTEVLWGDYLKTDDALREGTVQAIGAALHHRLASLG